MWFWRRVEIGWTDRVRYGVLHSVKEQGNLLYTTERRNARLLTSCVLKQDTEEKIEGMIK